MFLMHQRGSRARPGLERNLHASHFYRGPTRGVTNWRCTRFDNLQNPAADFECCAGTFHVIRMLLGREGSGHHDQSRVWFCLLHCRSVHDMWCSIADCFDETRSQIPSDGSFSEARSGWPCSWVFWNGSSDIASDIGVSRIEVRRVTRVIPWLY